MVSDIPSGWAMAERGGCDHLLVCLFGDATIETASWSSNLAFYDGEVLLSRQHDVHEETATTLKSPGPQLVNVPADQIRRSLHTKTVHLDDAEVQYRSLDDSTESRANEINDSLADSGYCVRERPSPRTRNPLTSRCSSRRNTFDLTAQ